MKVYRGTAVAISIPNSTETRGTVTEAIMSLQLAEISFTLPSRFEFLVGDWVRIHGKPYFLNNTEDIVNKISSKEFAYTLKFESEHYKLIDWQFLGANAINNLVVPNFPYMGTASDYIDLLLLNIARHETGWRKGNVIDTVAKPMDFAGENCLSVLSKLAQEFGTEFHVENRIIHLNKQGKNQPVTLEYGRGNGLYKITKQRKAEQRLVTRLYVQGGTKNISGDYRDYSDNLLMPESVGYYLEQNVDRYGVKEGSVTFEDIYPKRVGVISGRVDIYTYEDLDLNFDVSAHLMPGVTAKVTFQTGQLAGYTLEATFNYTNKTFKVVANSDDKATPFPNELIYAKAGDEYIITDILMPQYYKEEAENDLLTRGQEELAKISNSNETYLITPDQIDFKFNKTILYLGDSVTITEPDFNLSRPIRITALTRDVFKPYLYHSITLEDIVQVPGAAQVAKQIKDIEKAIVRGRLQDPYYTKMNWKSAQELMNMLFDPENNYFTEIIRPIVIETSSITVGTKSGQYLLKNIVFSPNENGMPSRFSWTAGELIHYEIENAVRVWSIDSGLVISLVDQIAYYLYAKCDVSGNTGTILVTREQIKTEGVPGFYHFPIGVLHSVVDGVRALSLTYGFTNISGQFIRTGVIISNDGLTSFNLNEGLISGKIRFGNNGTSTVIDGNLITSSTIMLGSGTGVKVGMTGQGEADTSVRIWAGADFDNRNTAPYRVNQAGQLVATDADITGKITATSGTIGGLTLLGNNFYNETGEGNIHMRYAFPEGGESEIRIGTNSYYDLPEHLQDETRYPGQFRMTRKNTEYDNQALVAVASGGRYNNAIVCNGSFRQLGPTVYDPFRVSVNSASYTANNSDAFLVYYPQSNGIINLPPNPQPGQTIKIRKFHTNGVTLRVFGNGRQIRASDNIGFHSFIIASAIEEFYFDGQHWLDMV